jgi:hypothetical protein
MNENALARGLVPDDIQNIAYNPYRSIFQELMTRSILDRYKKLNVQPSLDMLSPQQQRDLYIQSLGVQIRPDQQGGQVPQKKTPGLAPSFTVGNGGSEMKTKSSYYSDLAFKRKIDVDSGGGKKQLRYGN